MLLFVLLNLQGTEVEFLYFDMAEAGSMAEAGVLLWYGRSLVFYYSMAEARRLDDQHWLNGSYTNCGKDRRTVLRHELQ